jgi:hypothetical protein
VVIRKEAAICCVRLISGTPESSLKQTGAVVSGKRERNKTNKGKTTKRISLIYLYLFLYLFMYLFI